MQSSSAVNFPHLEVPKTARKRRRRQQTQNMRGGLSALKRFFINSRWVSLGLLALTIYTLVTIAQERRFYLTYIPVEGAKSITPEKVAEASGLAGSHIFSSDPAKAAEQIAEIPGVVSSTVTLRWPNEVLIQIAEEAPVAVWFENGVEYGITSNGRLIPAGFPTTGLLRIIPETGSIKAVAAIPSDEAVLNEEILLDEGQVAEEAAVNESENPTDKPVTTEAEDMAIVKSTVNEDGELPVSVPFVPQGVLAGALQLRQLRPGIEQLYYRPYGGLSYEDGRGWRGYFGSGENMNQKIVIYETIVEDLLSRGIRPVHISVSNQEKPYYLAQ